MEKVRIQDDLYSYVNQEWIDQAVIPDDKPLTGGFSLLADGVEERLIDDFEKMSASGNYPNEHLERACNLYKAVKDVKTRSKNGIKPALKKLNKITKLTNISSLNRNLSEFVLDGYPLPFDIGVGDDMKDTNKHCFVLQGPAKPK